MNGSGVLANLTWTIWPFAGVLTILNVIVGAIMLGHLKSLRRAYAASRRTASAETYELLRRLRELATTTACEVDQHSSRVGDITRELSSASESDEDSVRSMLVTASSRILQANRELQAELEAKKAELNDHAKQIEVHMAEARTDGLIGIPNRRALEEELARRHAACQRQGSPLSVIIIDLDHFKRLNDQHGHQAGDEVLREVGRVLADNARGMDFAARYGGEEFAFVLPGTRVDDAKAAAERIRTAIATNKFLIAGRQLEVTASLGLAELSRGDSLESLLKHADSALYAAKENGRNRTYFFDGETCLPVDTQSVKAASEVAQIVRQELKECRQLIRAERRTRPRRDFPWTQRVAPYAGDKLPPPEAFQEVLCRDITSAGFSFWLPEQPTFGFVIVALGLGDEPKYLAARVIHTTQTRRGGQSIFLVGCQFVRRVPTATEQTEAAVGTIMDLVPESAADPANL